MALRPVLLVGLALVCHAQAFAQARIELAAVPAWSGWARSGRATEVDVRLSSSTATLATLEVAVGRQTTHVEVRLEPGRTVQLHLPVVPARDLTVSLVSPAALRQRREVRVSLSESPLLGVGLASGEAVDFEGFHSVRLDADALPRDAMAYASMDALILDPSTLGALDQAQLGALLAHLAQCGRVVLLNPDERIRRALDGAGGCAGRSMLYASSLDDAKQMLRSSLAASLFTPLSLADASEFNRSGLGTWQRVLVVLAVYFAVAALAFAFVSSLPLLLLIPVLATAATFAVLHLMAPLPQLVVWSESESGAQLARYQAWEWFPGVVRGRARVSLPRQLASGQPCRPNQPMRLDYDPALSRVTFAEFDTRLFRQGALCFAGSFPVARSIEVEGRADGSLDVRNTGTRSWPAGTLLADRLVHDLPPLEPGASAITDISAGKPPQDRLMRTAMARSAPAGRAALWTLDLASTAQLPPGSSGWLLVSIPSP